MPKKSIDTFKGKAYFLKTCTENKYGNWDQHWSMSAGEFVIHEGKKHHVYIAGKKPKGGRKNMRNHCCPSVKRPKRNFYLKRYPHSYKKYRCRRPRK